MLSSKFDSCIKDLCADVLREAVLETEMDQLENELFSNLSVKQNKRKSTSTPPPLSPPPAPPLRSYSPPKLEKIIIQPHQPKKKHLTLCQAICATTLEQFPNLITNPQLLLSLTVQQTLSVQSMLENGEYESEDETAEARDRDPGEIVLVSPGSTMICREHIGYDQPYLTGPLENYSDAQVHYDMIPRAEWNVMIPGLQARPCFLKRVRKVPKAAPQYKSRHEEVFARRPAVVSAASGNGEDEQEFIVCSSSPESEAHPACRSSVRIKPKKVVHVQKRDLFEKIVTSLMERLPTYTRSSVIKLVRDVRETNGGLSGRSTEEIVRSVLDYEVQQHMH